jgi:uncharacterized membrane protein
VWKDIRFLSTNLLGHYKADSYDELMANCLSSCQKLDCFMSLKILFWIITKIFFRNAVGHWPVNMANVFIILPQHWRR